MTMIFLPRTCTYSILYRVAIYLKRSSCRVYVFEPVRDEAFYLRKLPQRLVRVLYVRRPWLHESAHLHVMRFRDSPIYLPKVFRFLKSIVSFRFALSCDVTSTNTCILTFTIQTMLVFYNLIELVIYWQPSIKHLG